MEISVATYHSLGDYRKAIEYHEKRLKIAQEFGRSVRRRSSLWKSRYCLPLTG